MTSKRDLFPYAGTSGWTSTDTSRERAERADRTGLTEERYIETVDIMLAERALGFTWGEFEAHMGRVLNWHHGVISGAFSRGRKEGTLLMLTETRGAEKGRKSHVHVHRDFINGRAYYPFRSRSLPLALRTIDALLEEGDVDEARDYIAEMLKPVEAVTPPPRKRTVPRTPMTH